ncbi:MAG: VOC family protein [Planctomycetes bacterium]|nr:VOC family protein [Planctomycetota bacterium]
MSNPVTQFQILSKDPEATARFYGQLFGWTIDANNALGYRRIDTGAKDGLQGGIWPAPPEAPNFVQLFIQVDDCAAHVAKAGALGAKVIVPPSRLPDGDELAILLDPNGLSFGVFKPH